MGNSYRQILRSSSIIGGASLINILVGLARNKVAALLLGPSGLGLIGLLQSVMGTASAVSALGFATVGTRQIAEAAGREDIAGVASARRALFWGTLLLAIAGGTLLWAMRATVASIVLDDPSLTGVTGWLGLGVALAVASGSQSALLNGLRKLGDLARLSVGSAVLASTLGIVVLWLWGADGIVAFVLAVPLATFVVGHWYVAKLPKSSNQRIPFRAIAGEWRAMVRIGTAFMVAGVVATAGQLLVRTFIQRGLGGDALGQFQAAWMIAMTYMGFVLGAMGTDFLPRLSASIHDHEAVNRLVNEQSEVAMLLAGPVIVGMVALAPWVVELLYSDRFGDAVAVLRWQTLGDVFKIASWPLGFIIIAAGDGIVFMLTESLTITFFAALVWIGLPMIGVQATGAAFLGMYLLNLPVVYFLARRRTGFRWQRGVVVQLVTVAGCAVCVFLVVRWSRWVGAGFGLTLSIALTMQGLARLGRMANIEGPIGRMAEWSHQAMLKLGLWHD